MGDLILILAGACLVNNLVFDYMLGVDPVLAATRRTEPAADLALLMLLTLPWIALASHLLHNHVLVPLALEHLQLLCLVLLAPALVFAAGNTVARFNTALHERIAPFMPLVAVNSTILGVALLNAGQDTSVAGAFVAGLGFAAGLAVALLIVAAIREKVSIADIPAPFRGVAILLVTLGLVSMAFMGFNGIGARG